MRVSREQMETGHRTIVESAARLLRERGLSGTSVADAMSAAGKTHGGFYRHFGSKDHLVAEALRAAFDEFLQPLQARAQAASARAAADEYKALYLCEEHVAHPGQGCPMPALAGELARASDAVKAEFSDGVRRVIGRLADGRREKSPADRESAAARELAMMVGAVLLARACDAPTARKLLVACRS